MNRYFLKPISILAAALFVLTTAAVPATGAQAKAVHNYTKAWRAHEIYNAHDYQKLADFLEQSDATGMKNREKLCENYDVLDPSTWGVNAQNEPRFGWAMVDGELRLAWVSCRNIAGGLSGALDLSGCTALEWVDMSMNALSSIDLSLCPALYSLNCATNRITALNVSGCTGLRFLECRWNLIPTLELSSCSDLSVLICTDNRLKTLNLSANPLLGGVDMLRMRDGGNKFISCFISTDPEFDGPHEYFISADCADGCSTYNGWYTEDGRFITDITVFAPTEANGTRFVARFASPNQLPGDADANGTVDLADSLRILRISMGLLQMQSGDGADVNGDGAVNMADAMLVMRRAVTTAD